jgi:hypothetical protein
MYGIVLPLITLICAMGLIRALMIMIGAFKDPILARFEEYGPEEHPYLPLVSLMPWLGGIITCIGFWVHQFGALAFGFIVIGLLISFLTFLTANNYEFAAKLNFALYHYPNWYHELRDRTSRYERRRIAYMWLQLPLRTRLSYNSHNHAFLIWVDFVIMATIREEEYDPLAEEIFYTSSLRHPSRRTG